jgi:hypothetical protein
MIFTPGYFVVKLGAYVTWMWVGLSLLRPGAGARLESAVAFGTLRLLMGFVFGLLIWVAGTFVYVGAILMEGPGESPLPAGLLTYLLVYVPVRWVEWGIFELVLDPGARSFFGLVYGSSLQARSWRAGGAAISCLADIPVIASLGWMLPVGRFMC